MRRSTRTKFPGVAPRFHGGALGAGAESRVRCQGLITSSSFTLPNTTCAFAAAPSNRKCCADIKPLWRRLAGFAAMRANELEAAIARDFGEWVKQERLPRPPRRHDN